jgi:Domain of unknown function (DUF4919)
MRPAAILAVPLLFTSVLVCNQATSSVSEYAALRDKVKSGDLSIDFKRLRISFVDSPESRQARDTEEQSKKMVEAINAKDFRKALKNADVLLENDYTDMDAHFAEYIAFREMGDSKQADFHRAVFDGLIRSILNSGDGKSEDTAYVVASVHEEYVVMRALGLQPKGQSLARKDGHSYDVMEVKESKSGQTSTVYFNVDVSMNHMLNLFGGKK